MVALLFISVLVVAIASAETQAAYSIGQSWAPFIAFTCIAWLIAYGTAAWLYFGNPYLFSMAYIVALAVFHLGVLVPYALGMIDVQDWTAGPGRWFKLAGWYTALAFGLFGIGFAATCLRNCRRRSTSGQYDDDAVADWNIARLRNLAVGLAIAAILGLFIATLKLGNLLAYTRFDLFFRASDPRFLSLFFYMGPTAALALVVTARTPKQRLASYSFGACILIIVLLSGNRSWAFFPLLAGAVLWAKLGRRIPLTVSAGIIAGVLLVIPVIAMLRSMGTYEHLSLRDLEASQEQSSITGALREMGASLGTLAVTLQYIPREEPYRFGRQYLLYLRQAIPNIGLSASKEYSRDTIYQRIRSNPRYVLELDPADWASWKLIPDSFLAGAGTGYSAIAEAYFSFGYVGVAVWFIGLGWFLARMDLTDMRIHYRWLIFATFFFWSLPVTARNTFGVFTKPAALILSVMAIWVLVRRFTPLRRPPAPRRAQTSIR